MPDKKILDKIIEAILKVVKPDKIILFGSQARGDARPDSDYDILIIKSGVENTFKLESSIYMNLEVEAGVDLIVATPEIIEQYKNTLGCVIKPALKEGVVVYE